MYRAIVALDVVRLPELGKDVLSQHLAELNAHLICNENGIISKRPRSGLQAKRLTKRVDAPHNTLHEDLMLIQRNQGTYPSKEFNEHSTVRQQAVLAHQA